MGTVAEAGHRTEKASDRSEWDKFVDFTRRLVKVPKHEVDAERAKSDSSKRTSDTD